MTYLLTICFLLVALNAIYSTLKYFKALRKIKLYSDDSYEEIRRLAWANLLQILLGIVLFIILSLLIAKWGY